MLAKNLAPLARRSAPRIVNAARWLMLRALLRPRAPESLVRLGSTYGGWWVPTSALRPGTVAYTAGVGEDMTFDLELHRHGCSVTAFDPTPRSVAYAAAHAPASDTFQFVPVGWWSREDELRFYSPADPAHVSHSVRNLQRTDTYFVAPVKPVWKLMSELGHTKVDLIKMDIEGAEDEVVRSLLRDGPLPRVLCVEFDQPQSLRRMLCTARALQCRGFRVAKLESWNLTFVRVWGTHGHVGAVEEGRGG